MAIPTETVYGLAANALDAKACRQIFRAKRRPANDPLIVHVANTPGAKRLAEFNPVADALARSFWPGPLTLVLPKKEPVPAIVTSGQATVALRSPAHPLARQILLAAGVPLAAPSANPFGYVSPTTAEHVLAGLTGRIPHVLDGGPCRIGVESTIVDASNPRRLTILRPGAVTATDIRAALRQAGLVARVGTRRRRLILAPGLLDQHYSPHTPFRLVARLPRKASRPTPAARIYWTKPTALSDRAAGVFWLSQRGDAQEAARRLYAVLRAADVSGHPFIECEKAPGSAGALGLAINDRLKRAAGRSHPRKG